MSDLDLLVPDADGYHHPATEEELAALVRHAYAYRRQLRVRGAGHTAPTAAIQTDDGPGAKNEINVMLDRYRAVRWIDRANGIVEVEAGCNLGIDPRDPTGTSTLENGLLHQLDAAGWALPTLGGITHQTVSGFLSTGSSGGTIRHSIADAVVAVRFIDGTGEVRTASRAEAPDLLAAIGVAFGLLGVISTVTFACVPRFDIQGQESITGYDDCPVDVFGGGSADRPSLESFLRDAEYARLMWWPQKGFERIVVWQARAVPSEPTFERRPYTEIARPQQLIAGLLLTILGNLDDLSAVPPKLDPIFDQVDDEIEAALERFGLADPIAATLGDVVAAILEGGVDGALDFPGMQLLARKLRERLSDVLPFVLSGFVPLDRETRGGEPQRVQDHAWLGLPMDNGVDDDLVPMWFSELWVPLSKAHELVTVLREHFERGGLAATGTFAFELYGSKASPYWLSPSFGEDAVRVDLLWFARNAGSPETDFYPQFWELLRPLGFRLHWGKYLPVDQTPERRWARYIADRHPRWSDFAALRRTLDPGGIFLTEYWRERLLLDDVTG